MPKGELLEYLSNIDVKGYIYYHLAAFSTLLGGHGNPRSDTYTLFTESRLNPSYMVIVASSRDFRGNMVWRVSLNGVTLTREFKPQTLLELDDRTYSVHVFDITNITKAPGRYDLKLTCESSEPVSIDAMYIVGVMRNYEITATLNLAAGILGIKPSEEIRLRLSIPESMTKKLLVLIYESPSRRAVVDVSIGNSKLVIAEKVGTSELILSNLDVKGSTLLRLSHRTPSLTYYPKYFKIYGVILYSTNVMGPNVVINNIMVRDDEGVISVDIANTGDTKAENILLVGLRTGNVVIRDRIDVIKPRSVIHREYKLSSRSDNLVLRMIYQGLNGQVVKTYKVNIK